MSQVVVNCESEVASDGSGGGFERVGCTHHGSDGLGGVCALDSHGHDWTAGEIVADILEEWSLLMLGIVCLDGGAFGFDQLQTDHFQASGFDAAGDFPDQVALNAAWFDENESRLHFERTLPKLARFRAGGWRALRPTKATNLHFSSKVQSQVITAEIKGLTVRYGRFEVMNNFSAYIPEGCVGLLGPNGAGKTTLIKTLLGFVKPAAGTGSVLGFDIEKEGERIRQVVGYMPEQDCHIPGMSGVEFVAYVGELAGMPPAQALRRAHEVLEYCGLGEARYRLVETFSTGMKQRVKFAQALVHGPKLLLLDEPTNGLDPRGREEMLALIKQVSQFKGISVLISSHLLKDIERTCESVILVMKGRLCTQGSISELTAFKGSLFEVELREKSMEFAGEAAKLGLKPEIYETGARYRVTGTPNEAETARLVFQAAVNSGSQVRQFTRAQRSLEEAFLEVVNEQV